MKQKKRLLFRVGRIIALSRAQLLDGFYSVHVRIRKLHDNTYKRGGWYKKYSDVPYTSHVHKATLWAFVFSFFFFTIIQYVLPSVFLKPNVALAGSNSKTWTTRADFETATTNSQVVFSGDNDANDANNNDSITQTNSLGYMRKDVHDPTASVNDVTYGSDSDSTHLYVGGLASGVGYIYKINKATGVADASFGSSGKLALAGSSNSVRLAVDSTSIYVVFTDAGSGGGRLRVEKRDKTTGALDLTFGASNGYITHNQTASSDDPNDIKLGGTSVFIGFTANTACCAAKTGYVLKISQSTGAVDLSYGGSSTGVASFNTASNVGDTGKIFFYNDKIYVAPDNYSGTVRAFYRLTSSGVLDGTFGTSGLKTLTAPPGIINYMWIAGFYVNADGIFASYNVTTTNTPFGSLVKLALNDGALLFENNSLSLGNYVMLSGLYVDSQYLYIASYDLNAYNYYFQRRLISNISIDTSFGSSGNIIVNEAGYSAYGYNGFIAPVGSNFIAMHNKDSLVKVITYGAVFNSPATLGGVAAGNVGLKLDAGATDSNLRVKPTTLAWNGTTASTGQKILFKVRAGNTQAELDANQCYGPTTLDSGCADWTTAGKFFSQANASGVITNSATTIPSGIGSKRYLEILVRLESDGSNNPVLSDVTLSYDSLESPVNSNMVLTKSDGTYLKTMFGNSVLNGNYGGGAFTNETGIKVTVNNLTCGGGASGQPACSNAATNLRPQVQVSTLADSAFAAPVADVTATAGNVFANITGLSDATSYHIRTRAVDDQGRVSGWTSYGGNLESDADFTVDQTAPTGSISGFKTKTGTTISLASGKYYTQSQDIKVSISAADNGGSNLAYVQLSPDGTNWGSVTVANGVDNLPDTADDVYSYVPNGTTALAYASHTGDVPWQVSSGDNEKTVYMRVVDNGGMQSGTWLQTSQTDFDNGTTKSSITTDANGSFGLTFQSLPPNTVDNGNGTWTTSLPAIHSGYIAACYVYPTYDSYWGAGSNATNVGSGGDCSGGGDPGRERGYVKYDISSINGTISNAVLISTLSFPYGTTYKNVLLDHIPDYLATGWQTVPFASNIATYATPATPAGQVSTSVTSYVQQDKAAARTISAFGLRDAEELGYTNFYQFAPGVLQVTWTPASTGYLSPGSLVSSAKDNTSVGNYGKLSWSANVPSQTGADALRFQVASNNDNATWNYIGPDGTAASYYTASGTQIHTSHNGSRYIRYKAYLQTANATYTPTVYDVSLEVNTGVSQFITLDITPPAAFDLTTPANNTWQGSASPTLNWNGSADPGSGLSKYQLYIDNVLNKDNLPTNATSTTPAVALAEGSHTWYVKAFDNAGSSTQSTSTFTVSYDATLPLGPQSFNTTNAVNTITLDWSFANNNGAPIAFVKVERIDWANYNPALPGADWSGYLSYKSNTYTGDITQVIYSTTDLDPNAVILQGKQYAYRISAKDSVNAAYGTLSPVRSGLTQDSKFDIDGTDNDYITNVTVAACDGSLNCSTDNNVRHKGYEIKLTWNPGVDNGVGTSHYLVYRATQPLNEGNYTNQTLRDSYQVVGVLPYTGGAQQPTWYDNDANNDGVTTFYDGTGAPITISPEIQALTTKTGATTRLSDYTKYYYRIVGVDALNNKSAIFPESPTMGEFDVLKVFANGNTTDNPDRTPDVSAPSIPSGVSPVATGIDDLNTQPDPTQGVLVSWAASSENSARAVTYKLYRSLGTISGPGTWEVNPIYTGSNTSFQDKGLTQDSYYYYRLTAEDPDGASFPATNRSALSAEAGVKTRNSSVPTTPTYVTVRATKGDPSTVPAIGHEISIQFNGSAIRYSANKITGYELYRSTTNYGTEGEWFSSSTKLSGIVGLNVTGYDGNISYDAVRNFPNDTGLTDATTYYYRVRAVGSNSEGTVYSGLSSIQTATLNYGWDTTPDATKPLIPTSGLEVKVRDTHPNNVEYRNIITWVMLSGADRPSRPKQSYEAACEVVKTVNGVQWCNDFARYELHREVLNPTNNAILSDTKVADVTNIADNYYIDKMSLALGSLKYRYYIIVVDNASTGFKYQDGTVVNANSNITDKQYAADAITPELAKPALSGAISLSSVSVSSAQVSWTTDQDADSLVEFRVKNSGDSFVAIGQIDKTVAHTVKLFGLKPLTEYEYRIVSRNYLGNNVQYDAGLLPALTTTGFNVTPGPVTTTTSTAEITWTTNLDAASAFVEYQLQRQSGDEPQSGTAGVSAESLAQNPRNHKVIIKGLRSNRPYTYKIKSISKDNYLAEYPSGGGSNFETFRTKAFDTGQFTLAPSSSNVAERNITSTNAQIIWQTAVPTTTWVDYGTNSGVYDISSGNNDLTNNHVVVLDGLVPGTRYFYRVRVKDANEVEFTSQEYSFKAVLKPKISGLKITDVTPYTITISWDTNIETETLINWGRSSSYGEKKGVAGTSKTHVIKIDNLEDNTEYHYQILARDETGEEVADDDKVVRTPLDTEGPKIESVKTDILPLGENDAYAQVIISWKTNKPATTMLQYDEGIIGGTYSKSSIEDQSLTTSHTVIVKDLDPAKTYHYRIVAKDKRTNKTISNDYNFITPAKEKSILQLIIKSLEETFSWVRNVGSFFQGRFKKTN